MSALRHAVAALALAAATVAGAAEPAPSKPLAAFFEREFRNAMEEQPEVGTYLGLEGFDHRVTDLSPQAIARRNARIARASAELKAFDPVKLNTQDRISREVMLETLARMAEQRALYGSLPFGPSDSWMRVSSMGGPQLTWAFIVKATRFRGVADYEKYLKRLEQLPAQFAQDIDLMRVGMKSGWMPPRAAMQQVPAMFDVFAGTDVTATPM